MGTFYDKSIASWFQLFYCAWAIMLLAQMIGGRLAARLQMVINNVAPQRHKGGEKIFYGVTHGKILLDTSSQTTNFFP
jgi:hypothetical protein